MPIYATKCPSCGKTKDVYLPVSRYKELPECCGKMVERVIVAPMVLADIQPYQSTIDGSMITSRSQHKAHLKSHGMVEVGNERPKQKTKEIPDVGGLREELYARVSDAKAAA
jgi:hypothetical protein